MSDTKELQVKDKQEVASLAEPTRPGRYFTPAVDIFENETEMVLLADMPGVPPENVDIDLRENILSLKGDIAPYKTEGEQSILSEYDVGVYYRQFTLSEAVDQSRIEAKADNGVLRLTLPKAEKALPKKITVNAA